MSTPREQALIERMRQAGCFDGAGVEGWQLERKRNIIVDEHIEHRLSVIAQYNEWRASLQRLNEVSYRSHFSLELWQSQARHHDGSPEAIERERILRKEHIANVWAFYVDQDRHKRVPHPGYYPEPKDPVQRMLVSQLEEMRITLNRELFSKLVGDTSWLDRLRSEARQSDGHAPWRLMDQQDANGNFDP